MRVISFIHHDSMLVYLSFDLTHRSVRDTDPFHIHPRVSPASLRPDPLDEPPDDQSSNSVHPP